MSKAVKATLGLFMVTILSKFLGFVRESVLVTTYGAGIITDAYITSMNIPSVIFAIIGSALVTTLIPLYFQIEKDKGQESSLKFLNNVFNIVIIMSILLSILGYIFAKPLTQLFAMKFTGDKLLLATQFTKTMIFGIVFIGISNIMTCILQIKGKFSIAGMVALPYNIIIIIIIIYSKGNVEILAIGTLLAMLSQFLFQLPFAYKKGYRYKAFINIKDPYIKKMVILLLPVFIGVGVSQINTIVDRSLASSLGDGIITVLNSANKLNEFATGLFISSISVVTYPILSKLSIQGKEQVFTDVIRKSINMIIILIVPVSIGAIVLATPVVIVVFERGNFSPNATYLTSIALSFYSIGMIGEGLRSILNRIFYSLKDTKTPMTNASLSVVINIILNLILIKFMGHGGLAFATSISSITCSLLLFKSLSKKIKYFGQDIIIKTTIKCIVSAVVMGIVTNLTYSYLYKVLGVGAMGELVCILCAVLVGAIIYTILVLLLKIEEVYIILNIAKTKFKKLSKNKCEFVKDIKGDN